MLALSLRRSPAVAFGPRGKLVLLGRRRAIAIRHLNTPPPPATTADIQSLQQELRALQQLIREQQSQSYHVESLTRSIAQQSAQLEQRLQSIEAHVSKISGVEKMVTNLRDFWHHNPAVRVLLGNLETVVRQSTPLVKKYRYALLGLLATLVVLWNNRSALFYQRTSEEVADLARMTLEQESLKQSIQDTLHTVANNPSTLQTLNDLVEALINHERTQRELVNLVVYAVNTPEVQKALLDLLEIVFQNPDLQKLTGEFLLKGLEEPSVKAMLDAQTAELVRGTVLDDSVQQATAVGVKKAFWYSVTPSFLWSLVVGSSPQDDKNSSNSGRDNGAKAFTTDESDRKELSTPNFPTSQ